MRFGIAVLFALSFVGAANASQDVGNVDAYEKIYVKCMSDGFPDSCLEHILSGHFYPGFPNAEKVASQAQGFLSAWKKDSSVFKVHFMGKRSISNVFDIRSYIVELSDGRLAGLRIVFKKILGKWYILDLQGAPTDSFIREMIDMPYLIPK